MKFCRLMTHMLQADNPIEMEHQLKKAEPGNY